MSTCTSHPVGLCWSAKGLGNDAVLSAGWQVSEMGHDSEMEQDRLDVIVRQEVTLR